MKVKKNLYWFSKVLLIHNSILKATILRILVCTLFSIVIYYAHIRGFQVSFPIIANIIPSVILGLLLVFRTNTANERFWEGRKLWGEINNIVLNIGKQIWVMPTTHSQLLEKKAFLELIWLFPFLVKNNLRTLDDPAIQSHTFEFISKEKLATIEKATNQPMVAMTFLQKDLMHFKKCKLLDANETLVLQNLLDSLFNCLGGCQRILKTPIPLAYSIHLNQLVLIYCLSLPFQFVAALGWITIPVVAITSFAVMGIEEIGAEIENPFGKDTNDLPIDTICKNIQKNITELMTLKLIDKA
jgi:ion channel-forming bestrophin family protein